MQIRGKLSRLLAVLRPVNRLKILPSARLGLVVGPLIPPSMMTGCRFSVSVPDAMNPARGTGFLVVLISRYILLITDRTCLILLLKLVRLGALMTPTWAFPYLIEAVPVRTATLCLCLTLPELTVCLVMVRPLWKSFDRPSSRLISAAPLRLMRVTTVTPWTLTMVFARLEAGVYSLERRVKCYL